MLAPKQVGMQQLQESNIRMQEELEALRGGDKDANDDDGLSPRGGTLSRLKSVAAVVGLDPELMSR